MVKCLQCNTMSVYMADRDGRDRCSVCNGYVIPQGKCNVVVEHVATSSLYSQDGLIETVCRPIER